METQQEIFIFASPELQEFLDDNRIDLVELLQRQGIVVNRSFARNPATSGDSTPKDLALILLASAGVILALTPILSKTITALSHKRIEAHEMVLIPVEDSHGNVVRNAAGEPILQWVEQTRLIESQRETPEVTTVSLKGPTGIELTFSTSPKEEHQEISQLPQSSSDSTSQR